MRAFANRSVAGRGLAEVLSHHADADGSETVVLAIGPGGVYVASQLASSLSARLDVLIVRDIVVGESTVGVLAEGGVPMLEPALGAFALHDIQRAIAREMNQVEETRHRFRGNQPFPSLDGATAILVDDVIDAEQAMLAAIHHVKHKGAARVVVATPAATQHALDVLSAIADEVVCLSRPRDLDSTYSAAAESLLDSDVLLHLQRARLAAAQQRHS